MKTAPKISVVVPAFNHETYVVEALESVLAQSLGDLELIVIDDASRDGTWAAIQSLRDPRLRALRHDTNRGAHATLNEGLALAGGDYLAILNSDDAFHPRRLERMVDAIGDTQRLAFSDVRFIDSDGHPAPDHERAQDHAAACRLCTDQPPASWLLTSNLAITTSNFVFPRKLLEKIGEFSDLRYTHDWEWALRASATEAPLWLREELVDYRVHPTNTLAEDDVWRHVHENAYIQTLALRQHHPELDATTACTALLRNRSLHPVSTLSFLVAAAHLPDPDALRALARQTDGNWFLPALARTSGLDERILLSARSLSEQQAALTAQAALIDERGATIEQMSNTIAERDICIAAQAKLVEERGEALSAQATMLEQRWAAMEHMGHEIRQRDIAIAERDVTIETQAIEIRNNPWNRCKRLLRRLTTAGGVHPR